MLVHISVSTQPPYAAAQCQAGDAGDGDVPRGGASPNTWFVVEFPEQEARLRLGYARAR
jgi:hypothetical protein